MNLHRQRGTGFFLSLAIITTLYLVLPADAAPRGFDYLVTRLDDPAPGSCMAGDCSLREAIRAANSSPGAETIGFAVTGTVELTRAGAGEDGALTGDLDITGGVAIEGPARGDPTALVVTSGGLDRVFDFMATPSDTPASSGFLVSVIDLTIAGGNVTASPGAVAGGGVRNRSANATLAGVIVRDNVGSGGALASGGGVANDHGTLVISDSAIINNGADIGAGVVTRDGTLYLHNSTVSGNVPTGQVGGVLNLATGADTSASLWLDSVTIAHNGPGVPGDSVGGLATTALGGGAAETFVKNSLVANNSGVQCAVGGGGSATITSLGYNLSSHAGCFFTLPTDIQALDPLLAPLQLDTSGPRPTYVHALLEGSPALDSGESAFATDARRVNRPQDWPAIPNEANGDDRGAVEMVADPPTAVTLAALSALGVEGVWQGVAALVLAAAGGALVVTRRRQRHGRRFSQHQNGAWAPRGAHAPFHPWRSLHPAAVPLRRRLRQQTVIRQILSHRAESRP